MNRSYLLLLVAIFAAYNSDAINAKRLVKISNFDANVELIRGKEQAHRSLKGSNTINEERLSVPGVKTAVSKLKSLFTKKPDLAKTLQRTPGTGFNLQNPAVKKEAKIVLGLLIFIVGTPVVFKLISKYT
ncbi:unnamed protein product [Phytophthora lilii]|uniref:Unnamed protein product n=1 Tax=Phytophthora lilii TaxID=2077276 RepID=A0A9W6TE28_9STRA|nr:unnamed protein product [Phytophthora lilii]